MTFLGTLAFTGLEVLTLAGWLVLVRAGSPIAGVVLIGGLTVEHLVAYIVVNNGRFPSLSAAGQKILVSLGEAGIWILWLILTATSPLFAFMVLAVLLVVEHTLSDNVFRDEGLLIRLVNRDTIAFSIIEAGGAALWLNQVDAGQPVVGLAFLTVASFLEHSMAVTLGQRPKTAVQ